MTRTTKRASSAVGVAALTLVLVSLTTPTRRITTTIGLKDLGLWEPKQPRRRLRMPIFVDLTWRQTWFLFWIEAVLTAILIYALVRIL